MWEWINSFVGSLLIVISSIIFMRMITNEKIKVKHIYFVLVIILISLIIQILNSFNLGLIKSIIIVIMFVFMYRFVYKLDMNKIIILSFCYFLLTLLVDIFSIKLLALIFGQKIFYEVIAGSLVGSLVVTLFMCLLSFGLRNVINKLINIKVKYKLVLILLISLMCVIAIYYATYRYGSTSLDNLLGFLYIIVVTMILVSNFVQEYKNNKLTLEYDNLLEFIKKYEVEIDNQRILRHENKNQLLTIKSKIIDKDKNEEIIKYIDEVLNDRRNVKQIEYAKFSNLPSNGIKGLLYFKVATAQEKNIRVEVNISKEINKSFLSKLDSVTFNQLGKILGVYLDNAIEGAETSNDKIMGIEIFLKDKDVMFIISNSYSSKIKKRGRTTKGVGHGYGLLLVNSILSGNKRFESTTEIINNLYVKKLIVKE